MTHYIVVREDGPGRFTAYPCGLPELTVTADSHGRAVEAVRDQFLAWTREGKLDATKVTIAGPREPTFSDPIEADLHREFIEEIARNRQREDDLLGIWRVEPGDEEKRRWVEETIRYRQEHLRGTIWDYEIPWPSSSSTPTTSPTTPSATSASGRELVANPPAALP